MRFSLSPSQLPELAHLSEPERSTVLFHYRLSRTSALRFRYAEIGFVAFIILAEIAGFVGGWFFWRGFWGSLAGAIIAMSFVMITYYIADVVSTALGLRHYVRSEQGRFILEHAKKLSGT